MSVTTGSIGATATPATDLYNILATALGLNANWTQSGVTNASMNAADSGTTAATQTWKNTGGVATFFVNFEIDDTNARLRFRAAEDFDGFSAAGAKKIRQPVGPGGTTSATTDATSVTPTANGTVIDTDVTWGTTNPFVGYGAVKTAAGGYNYLFEVRNHLITIATQSGGAQHWSVLGEYTPLATKITDSHPLFMATDAYQPSGEITWSPAATAQRVVSFSRAPGRGAVAATGQFTGGICPLHFPIWASTATASQTDADLPYNGSHGSDYYTNNVMVSTAVIHGTQAGSIGDQSTTSRAFRGYLPDFVSATATTAAVVVGDTLTISGTTYYVLGVCLGVGTSRSLSEPVLFIKA